MSRGPTSHEKRIASAVRKIHEYKEKMEIDVFYPGHEPRKPTALYTKNHKAMCIEEDQPCYICGVRYSTLNDPLENPWKATAMETHHWIVEDSLAEAVDLQKFNQRIVRWWRGLPHHDPEFDHDFSQEQMIEWIHGNRHNLKVLCNVHHRAKVGVHHLPLPFWGIQDLLKDDFKFTPETPIK